MKKEIRELFAAMIQASAENVLPESTPKDFPKWDSMQHLILISSFEEDFDIVIDPDEIVGMFDDYKSFESVVLEKIKA